MGLRRTLICAFCVIVASFAMGPASVLAGPAVAEQVTGVHTPVGVRAWIDQSGGLNTLHVRVPPTDVGCEIDVSVARQTAGAGHAWTVAQYLIEFKNGEDTFQYVDDGQIVVHYRTLRSPSGFDLTWRGPVGRVVVTRAERSSGCATTAWPLDPRRA